MEGSYFFDTRSLRDHVSEVQEERRVAQRLRDAVAFTRDNSDPSLRGEYNHVIYSVEKVQRYFLKMAEVLDDTASETVRVSRAIQNAVRESTDRLNAENKKIQV